MPDQQSPLLTHTHQVDGTKTVRLPPEIDVTNASGVREALAAAISSGATTVVADMTGTAFCDCAGAFSIAQACERAAAADVELRVVIRSAKVQRLFATLHLDAVVHPRHAPNRSGGGG